MEIEPGFPCLNCGADVQVFFYKTGERAGWTCPTCKHRGWFNVLNQAILAEA